MKKRRYIVGATLALATMIMNLINPFSGLIRATEVVESKEEQEGENAGSGTGGESVEEEIRALSEEPVSDYTEEPEGLMIPEILNEGENASGTTPTTEMEASEEAVFSGTESSEGVQSEETSEDLQVEQNTENVTIEDITEQELADSGTVVEQETEEEEVVDVALPGDASFTIDQFSVHMPDGDTQILSEVFEIINNGNKDVVIDVKPSLLGKNFEFMDEKPMQGRDLKSQDAERARAVYLALQIADDGEEEDILEGDYAFTHTEYDQVLSVEEPDGFRLLLRAADESGEPVASGKAAFRLIGNVDPHAKYHSGELKVELVYSIYKLTEEEETLLREDTVKEKLNFMESDG